MNILYLASEPRIELSTIAGHDTHILKTIKGLENKGHYVHKIIAGERKEAQKAKGTFQKLKTRLPSTLSILLRDIYALAHDRNFFQYCCSLCQEKPFDFIYERATAYHRTGQHLSNTLGIPLILEVNSPLEELITLYGCAKIMIPVAAYFEKCTASEAHALVVGSAGMRRYLVEKGINAQKIFIIYPTADDAFFKPVNRRIAIRQQWGITDKVVVGFVGSMAAYHRVDLLLQAAIKVHQVSDNIHFLIVGDGEKMSDLKRFASAHMLEQCVTFTGRVPYKEVPEYCGAMDICVIPHATWYGSPTKLFEYAATGKPVIAPRIESIQELIRYGENGLLTELNDSKDLADKILTLAANPLLGQKLGRALHQEILRTHTWSKNTDKLIHIFESIKDKVDYLNQRQ
jgi:glycosyltransferase involved in cell wall biosynthesis